MLRVSGLRAWYGPTQALFGVDLVVDTGRAVALAGTNGAGKTTTIRAIAGLVRAAGRIELDGVDISNVPAHLRARVHRLAMVHEGRGLLYRFSVEENILVGSPRPDRQALDEVLELFPSLRDRLNERVANLSGGQQQFVALARAVARRPSLLLLDEPALGLAPVLADEIYEYLGKIRLLGMTTVLVEQSVLRARSFADTLVLLIGGRSRECVDSGDDVAVEALTRASFRTEDTGTDATTPPSMAASGHGETSPESPITPGGVG